MKVVLTGGTGFIGRELGMRLAKAGHEIKIATRSIAKARGKLPYPAELFRWDPETEEFPADDLVGYDAVIHLLGESIAEARWDEDKKERIYQSRVASTEKLARAMRSMDGRRPQVLIQASASCYYGDRADERLREESPTGDDFLAKVVCEWEEAGASVTDVGIRWVALRTGIVLGLSGGMLADLLPIFNAGLGCRLGTGSQWMPWIHIEDLCQLYIAALTDERWTGPVNGSAPFPVRNADFTEALAQADQTKVRLTTPAAMVRLAFGEMANVLLASQRVLPQRALDHGFQFKFPHIEEALDDLLGENLPCANRLIQRQWVPAPAEQVWALFEDPASLDRLSPDWVQVDVEEVSTPEIQKGTLIDYRMKVHSLPLSWQARIEEWRPQRVFIDSQKKGPFKFWRHIHALESVGGGTLVHDDVQYKLPAGTVGEMVGGRIARQELEKMFAERLERLARAFDETP